MLVFAATTPHPPLLLPTIGLEKSKELEKTREALRVTEQELYTSHPDIIFIISPHSAWYEDAFSVNADDKFISSFEDFGDLTTKKTWNGCPNMAAKIAHAGRKNQISINLVSDHALKHGASIPLFYLTEQMDNVRILPIGYAGMDIDAHVRFGELLKDVIMESDKRIAIIASGDLTHGIDVGNTNTLDTELMQALTSSDMNRIKELGTTVVPNTEECGYRSILILMGILKNMKYQFNSHCYQHPFGVGYLTGTFSL